MSVPFSSPPTPQSLQCSAALPKCKQHSNPEAAQHHDVRGGPLKCLKRLRQTSASGRRLDSPLAGHKGLIPTPWPSSQPQRCFVFCSSILTAAQSLTVIFCFALLSPDTLEGLFQLCHALWICRKGPAARGLGLSRLQSLSEQKYLVDFSQCQRSLCWPQRCVCLIARDTMMGSVGAGALIFAPAPLLHYFPVVSMQAAYHSPQ